MNEYDFRNRLQVVFIVLGIIICLPFVLALWFGGMFLFSEIKEDLKNKWNKKQ